MCKSMTKLKNCEPKLQNIMKILQYIRALGKNDIMNWFSKLELNYEICDPVSPLLQEVV